jgi:hypothetical protein
MVDNRLAAKSRDLFAVGIELLDRSVGSASDRVARKDLGTWARNLAYGPNHVHAPWCARSPSTIRSAKSADFTKNGTCGVPRLGVLDLEHVVPLKLALATHSGWPSSTTPICTVAPSGEPTTLDAWLNAAVEPIDSALGHAVGLAGLLLGSTPLCACLLPPPAPAFAPRPVSLRWRTPQAGRLAPADWAGGQEGEKADTGLGGALGSLKRLPG